MDGTSSQICGKVESAACPTRESLVERAREMVPILEKRAENCEKIRRAPTDTIDDFKEAGFFKIGLPKRFGGYEMDYDVLCEVIMEIAHGCGSSAWNLAVLGEHNYTLTNSTAEQLEELWSKDPDVLVASGNDPNARLEPIEGGYVLNACINFSSGCDYAGWWMTGAVDTTSGKRRPILVPKEYGVIIEDSWEVSGLAGSGSKSVEFKDVFIPYKHLRPMPNGPEWGGKAAGVQNSATYRLDQLTTKPFTLASVSVGIAGGVLRAFIGEMKRRHSRFGDRLSDLQSIQLRIAESAAEYDAAREIIIKDIQETISILRVEEDVPESILHRNRRDMAYTSRLAQASVDRLFYAAGAHAQFLDNNLQRQFKDVHAAGAQVFLNWDVNATVYGRSRLGLDPGGPVL